MALNNIFPTPPWPDNGTDYGRDLSCFLREVTLPMPDGTLVTTVAFDLAPDMAEVDGRLNLAMGLARRLVTFGGTLLDDPEYGYDLRELLNDDLGPRDLSRIAARTEAEIYKDERVVSCTATATLLNGVLVVSITVVDGVGPFKLTLTVDDPSVAVLFSGL